MARLYWTIVALKDDGLGYDVVGPLPTAMWHLEVKSTTRRGRLVIRISRLEYEIGAMDPLWRLVIVGLDSQHEAAAWRR